MDDLINPRTAGFKCLRTPPNLYFGNDQIGAYFTCSLICCNVLRTFAPESDHATCNRDLPEGCARCKQQTPKICCELCAPDSFTSFALPPSDISTQAKSKKRTRVSQKYKSGPHDMALRDALHSFRREHTVKLFDEPTLWTYGPSLIMSDAILSRIVDATHAHRIKSVEDLQETTHWNRAADLGAEVLALINLHVPPPPPPPPLRNANDPQSSTSQAASSAPRSVSIKRCGACGAQGHIGA
ncbi:hypothetical protein FA95DRAFT_1504847 [Auriscalpium vulgare]|uniref:Uncharacterized protein n=1 Tax=Auriscalpium vulgare TaxID=40419 RepID=A0ACB8R4Z1_9AGAM|nr:hypothetical protein FA95DRAFT_1504847 [Auriscalpium vulgare]